MEEKANFNPNQPRVPAGNPNGGRWTDAAAYTALSIGGAPYTRTQELDAAVAVQATPSPLSTFDSFSMLTRAPLSRHDPGGIPVVRYDGTIVRDPHNLKPILMPKGVSLQNNASFGESLRNLSYSRRASEIFIRMLPHGSMDYQNIYSDDGKTIRAYINFGNYNYGYVMAAAGFSVREAYAYAGIFNFGSYFLRNIPESRSEALQSNFTAAMRALWRDMSGRYLTNRSEHTFIRIGFRDYTNRHTLR